jgi:hypothetical protein
MGFDAQNFGIGLLAGWGSAYGIYRARHIFKNAMSSASAGAKGAQNYATRSSDSRYIKDLMEQAERTHLAGEFVKLSDVLMEPRFIPAKALANPDDEDDVRDIFDVVPRVYDHPFLHAAYNLDTLSIEELGTGDKTLALLGMPGSGRTTSLLAIAMYSLNRIQFKPSVDKVQQKIDAEDAKLSEKERATKIKERLTMEQRAKERLANEQGSKFDADASDEDNSAIPLIFRLMPVYVHMADIVIDPAEFGPEIDPAEPLVRAVQHRLGRVASSSIPRNLYNRLNKGGVMLLLDGFDDLPDSERAKYASWLQAFLGQYRQNFIVVAGPAHGYGVLTRMGLTPVFLRPFSEQDTNLTAERFADVWPRLSGKKRGKASRPDQTALDRAKVGNRALSPFEVTLKTWANYAGDANRLILR